MDYLTVYGGSCIPDGYKPNTPLSHIPVKSFVSWKNNYNNNINNENN
jgi:hypothetical protein